MHVLDGATDYQPADTDVLVRARGSWRRGRVTAWHRTRTGQWIAQVSWATGAPVHSSCVDFLPASELRDATACLTCPAARLLRPLSAQAPAAAAASAGP